MSLLLGLGGYAVVAAIPIANPVVLFVLGWLAVINVTLVVFNLLPAFPMDGGRVLRALLARTRPHAEATRIAARVGVWFAVLFAVVGVFSNVMLVLLALFIYMAAKGESRTTMLADLLEGFTAADIAVTDLPRVDADTPIGEFGDRMLADRRGARQRDRESTTVGDVTPREAATVGATTPAFDAVAALGQQSAPFVLVEDCGEITGIVTDESTGQVLALRESGLQLQRDAEPF